MGGKLRLRDLYPFLTAKVELPNKQCHLLQKKGWIASIFIHMIHEISWCQSWDGLRYMIPPNPCHHYPQRWHLRLPADGCSHGFVTHFSLTQGRPFRWKSFGFGLLRLLAKDRKDEKMRLRFVTLPWLSDSFLKDLSMLYLYNVLINR